MSKQIEIVESIGKFISYEEAFSFTKNFSYEVQGKKLMILPVIPLKKIMDMLPSEYIHFKLGVKENQLDLIFTPGVEDILIPYGISSIDHNIVTREELIKRTKKFESGSAGTLFFIFSSSLITMLLDSCTEQLNIFFGLNNGQTCLVLTPSYADDVPYNERIYLDMGSACPPFCTRSTLS